MIAIAKERVVVQTLGQEVMDLLNRLDSDPVSRAVFVACVAEPKCGADLAWAPVVDLLDLIVNGCANHLSALHDVKEEFDYSEVRDDLRSARDNIRELAAAIRKHAQAALA